MEQLLKILEDNARLPIEDKVCVITASSNQKSKIQGHSEVYSSLEN
mgnify:CR=1 FL=1